MPTMPTEDPGISYAWSPDPTSEPYTGPFSADEPYGGSWPCPTPTAAPDDVPWPWPCSAPYTTYEPEDP